MERDPAIQVFKETVDSTRDLWDDLPFLSGTKLLENSIESHHY